MVSNDNKHCCNTRMNAVSVLMCTVLFVFRFVNVAAKNQIDELLGSEPYSTVVDRKLVGGLSFSLLKYEIFDEIKMECYLDGGVGNFQNDTLIVPGYIDIGGGIYQVKIKSRSFQGNKELKRVEIYGAIIEDYSFMSCVELKTVFLKQCTIGPGAFQNCRTLVSVEMEECAYLYDGAFKCCESLAFVNMTEGLRMIGAEAFWGCCELDSINIPSSVERIGNSIMAYCPKLKHIEVSPDNVRYTSGGDCKNVIVDIESGVLISGCESSVVGSCVRTIGEYAFAGSSLKEIVLNEGVEQLSKSSFEDCKNIAQIKIPSSVVKIGSRQWPNVFSGCNLQRIEVEKGNKNYYSKNNCLIEKENRILVAAAKKSRIPRETQKLGPYALCSDVMRSKLHIPKSVREISGLSFYGCSGIKTVRVSPKNTTFDSRNRCNAIIDSRNDMLIAGFASTVIPSDVVSIGEYSFSGRRDSFGLIVPSNVDSIMSYAFFDCTGLENIIMSDSISYFGFSAFEGCQSLTSFSCPSNLQYISNGLFANCSSLEKVVINGNVTDVLGSSFAGCDNLRELYCYPVMPPNVADDAFTGSVRLHIPVGSKREYDSSKLWNRFIILDDL